MKNLWMGGRNEHHFHLVDKTCGCLRRAQGRAGRHLGDVERILAWELGALGSTLRIATVFLGDLEQVLLLSGPWSSPPIKLGIDSFCFHQR